MQTDLFTVSKLFTERLFRIPDYQRGYAWREKQLKDYWNDLEQLEDKSHYLGVLTLEDVPEEVVKEWKDDKWIIDSKGYTPFYIVDGQQRLTTTIILIQAITEVIKEGEKINYTSKCEIKRRFLWDSKDDGISRSYIFGYEKDNPSYEFLKTKIFNESSDVSFPSQDTIYTNNLSFAKEFFLKKIVDLDIRSLEEIYKKVTQQLLFNIYAISREIDVFVAFETMNNRGKPLSHLELLKNRLIYLSTKFQVEDYEKDNLRAVVNESWKNIYHYLGKNKDNPLDDDFFLRNHFLLYFGKSLTDEDDPDYRGYLRMRRSYAHDYKDYLLENHFTTRNIEGVGKSEGKAIKTKDIYDYSKSLKDSVEIWYQILNPSDSTFSRVEKEWLDKINRLGIEFVAPLIMVFYQKVRKNALKIEFLKALEKLIFLNELVRYRHYMTFDPVLFLEMSSKLSSGKSSAEDIVKELTVAFESGRDSKEIWKIIQAEFIRSGYYGWRGIRYFLYEYDLNLKSQSKTQREKIDWDVYIDTPEDYHTVEHIYPQRARRECWTKLYAAYTNKERSVLRHSLGNLVPLSRPKNSSFSNKCFQDKVGDISTKVGFRYGSYAENEIATYEKWGAVEILQRGVSLLDFMDDRWSLKIGDRGKKVKMLGLEFVEEKEGITKKRRK
ncbi:DUF262 domain-containing protein [Halomonas sp. TBZ9]|uniref:DUF262 domain-containing protein n=1 Tax=Vreelandella azerica TaxID=2732867 RepID=A0A7Y3XAQ6_9GAMM|nr:DUF262 domain-containing protein [Halomonas azerica]NOG31558.1 DUF262 domain-containing protein [Halomonas azerica]